MLIYIASKFSERDPDLEWTISCRDSLTGIFIHRPLRLFQYVWQCYTHQSFILPSPTPCISEITSRHKGFSLRKCWDVGMKKCILSKYFFSQGFHLFRVIFNRKFICLKMFLFFMLMVKYFEIIILSISQKKLKKNLFKKLSNAQGSFLNFWQGILKSMKYHFLIISIDFSNCLIKSVGLLKWNPVLMLPQK